MIAATLFEPADDVAMSRAWAMPSPHTFTIAPISDLLDRWLFGRAVVVDPFAGQSTRAQYRNDLSRTSPALTHKDAGDWCDDLWKNFPSPIIADAVLFDPPYSPRQIAECYKSVGLPVGTMDTQNARLYRRVKDRLDRILRPGGVAICCGWNSAGFGLTRGYALREILIVAHGGAHNDTIVTVEVKQ